MSKIEDTVETIKIVGNWIMRIANVIAEALRDGVDDEEIRRRISSPDVILKDELDKIRARKNSLRDFVENGD